MQTLPLIPHSDLNAVIAYQGTQPVSSATFLGHVHALAQRLPATGHTLNLCKNRYWFSVGLFASISRGLLSLMPSATAPALIDDLRQTYPDLICLSDQDTAPFSLPHIAVHATVAHADPINPKIPLTQEILCVFTSGSTGKPRGHIKTFGRMRQCASAGAQRLLEFTRTPCAVVGTVPFQHMYGLESTLFLPLLGQGTLTARLPFFPADVAAALADVPEPRVLVTTPFHLRKLIESDIRFPTVAALISATAPLSSELAAQAESRFQAPVVEIYGSTETGQLATRQTAIQQSWACYDGIRISQQAEGALACGGHLEAPQYLNDVIELDSAGRFKLMGRHSDIVNVAGKRNSLAHLNQILVSLPGVQDGVFYVPEQNAEQDMTRLAAFVVAPELHAQAIQAALLEKLDPLFVPRPIFFVESLPRDGNGKLTAAALAALIAKQAS